MNMNARALAALFAAAVLAHGGAAAARNDQDHEAARAALARGEILPLTRILAVVAQRSPGDILEVELDRERTRFIYEITVLSPAGKVVEVRLDAKTAAVIEDDDYGQDARERALEQAEAAREKAQTARAQALEKAQAAREQALEKAQAAREQAQAAKEQARR
jgi:uncharacterized membrane protein YkoI